MEFNNREIASFIILIALMIYILVKATNRNEIYLSFLLVLKSIFSKYILTTIVLLIFYVFLEISFLQHIGFFDSSMLKDSIIWSFGAFGLIMKNKEITKKKNFIGKLILDNLKFIVFFEFLINMYSFNLFVEIILISTVMLFVMMKTVLEHKELNQAEQLTMNFINVVLGLIGMIVILFTIDQFYNHYNEIEVVKSLKSFTLPLLLITFYIPFYYSVILYSKYEQLFISINFYTRGNERLTNYLKRKIFFSCFLSFSKLQNTHSNIYKFQGIDSKHEIDKILKALY